MGYISEFVFKKLDYVRTSHPMYSFFIVSKSLEFIRMAGMDCEYCFGEGTIFDFLVDQNGLQVCLNLNDSKCMTFYHHAEKIIGAPHRFEKQFRVVMRDTAKTVNAMVYVRKPGFVTDVSGIEKLMWNKGIWRGRPPMITSATERWCSLSDCISVLSDLGPNNLEGMVYREKQ